MSNAFNNRCFYFSFFLKNYVITFYSFIFYYYIEEAEVLPIYNGDSFRDNGDSFRDNGGSFIWKRRFLFRQTEIISWQLRWKNLCFERKNLFFHVIGLVIRMFTGIKSKICRSSPFWTAKESGKMKIFAVKNSALLLRKMRRKNGAVKTSELRSSVAKEDKEKNAW